MDVETLRAALRGARLSPVFDTDLADAVAVNLSIDNPEVTGISGDHEALGAVISARLQATGARVAWGGYLERRDLYSASPAFAGGRDEPRSVHLGIDVWAPAGTAVHAPLAGTIHSFAFNDAPLDYGGTVLVAHQVEGRSLVTLFGHLSRDSLAGLEKGRPVAAGEVVGRLGQPDENGGWPPHLHFQVILDMGEYEGDFPGACRPGEVEAWSRRCPDPAPLLGLA